jgi:hypothetical protein
MTGIELPAGKGFLLLGERPCSRSISRRGLAA